MLPFNTCGPFYFIYFILQLFRFVKTLSTWNDCFKILLNVGVTKMAEMMTGASKPFIVIMTKFDISDEEVMIMEKDEKEVCRKLSLQRTLVAKKSFSTTM